MPATVIYKQGFPNLERPVETSASIGADGLVTGSAVFLVAPAAPATTLLSTASLSIGTPISASFFSGLRDVVLQGLFIETRNLEKRNGLTYLRLGVVGALNPPIVERKRDVSPRGFSKSDEEYVFSFDYQAESHAASTVLTTGQAFTLIVPRPREINIWNIAGTGFISRIQESGKYDQPTALPGEQFVATRGIIARPRVLINESSEQRVGIIRITKTAQFIYE
jgi:hypothetical protein